MATPSIALVANAAHQSILNRTKLALETSPGFNAKIHKITLHDNKASPKLIADTLDEFTLIVPIGSKATRAVIKSKTQTPILSILIRKYAFDAMVDKYHLDKKSGLNVSAIYLDQPIERQLNFVEAILEKQDKEQMIGVLLGPHSSRLTEKLLSEAKIRDLKLKIVKVNHNENPVEYLDLLLEDAKILLAIPDSKVYNPKTARGMLLTAYRKRVPIVGFSKTYVCNGAMASLSSTPKQIVLQAANQIVAYLNNQDKKLPPPSFTDGYRVNINQGVAKSLGLELDSDTSIYYALKQREDYTSITNEGKVCRYDMKKYDRIQQVEL